MRVTTIAILVLAVFGGTAHLWRNGDLSDLAFLPAAWTASGSASAGAESTDAASAADAETAANDTNATDRRGGPGTSTGSSTGTNTGATRESDANAAAKAPAATPGKSVYYQWVDDQGSVHFARSLDEVPPDWRGRAGQFEVDADATAPAASPKPSPKLASAGSAAAKRARAARHAAKTRAVQPVAAVDSTFSRNHDVTVYTAPWCGWCRKTMAFLDERGVVYENKDIESDPAYEDELREKTGKTAIPFVEIDDAEIHGFNPVEMTRLLID